MTSPDLIHFALVLVLAAGVLGFWLPLYHDNRPRIVARAATGLAFMGAAVGIGLFFGLLYWAICVFLVP